MSDLQRFTRAQARDWDNALRELQAGDKISHWMWYIFPQIAGLGRSPTARLYAIRDLAEAREFLADTVLGPRLALAAHTMLNWAGRRSAEAILGDVDAMKLRSSMTLFEAASDEPLFGEVLDAFFASQRDVATLRLLG